MTESSSKLSGLIVGKKEEGERIKVIQYIATQ
jgi:hypothetical protein